MAVKRWQGGAAAVAGVWNVTPNKVDAGDTYGLKINNHVVSFVSTGLNSSDVVIGLTAAWNASTVPEFAELTASSTPDTYMKLTADTAGIPHTISTTVTAGATGTTGPTLTITTGTTPAGPYHFTMAENWEGGVAPSTATDDIVFENSAVSCLYGLDSTGYTANSLTVAKSFTGAIGLPRTNANGYREYRSQFLKLDGPDTINIGVGDGAGSSRIKIDSNTVQTDLNVWGSGSDPATGEPAVQWKGTHASNTGAIRKGHVGIGWERGSTGKFLTLKVSHAGSVDSDAEVEVGPDCTLEVLDVAGGDVSVACNTSTINQTAGAIEVTEDATVAALNADGGTCYYRSSGTISALTVSEGAVDFTRDDRSRTVSDCSVYAGATILDGNGTVTWTTGIKYQKCNQDDVTVVTGKNRQWLEEAI